MSKDDKERKEDKIVEIDLFDSSVDKKSSWTDFQRCYHKHKPFEVVPGALIYGGSCISPSVSDAEIYIGFDSGMKFSHRHFPWNDGTEILYRIQDGSVPQDMPNWTKLVEWAADQVLSGRKVHCGCIGGHGRTGLFLVALRATMFGDKDAIRTVRKEYCDKAVETTEQVKFLVKHYGVESVDPYKKGFGGGTSGTTVNYPMSWGSNDGGISKGPSSGRKYYKVKSQLSVWGKNVRSAKG